MERKKNAEQSSWLDCLAEGRVQFFLKAAEKGLLPEPTALRPGLSALLHPPKMLKEQPAHE